MAGRDGIHPVSWRNQALLPVQRVCVLVVGDAGGYRSAVQVAALYYMAVIVRVVQWTVKRMWL